MQQRNSHLEQLYQPFVTQQRLANEIQQMIATIPQHILNNIEHNRSKRPAPEPSGLPLSEAPDTSNPNPIVALEQSQSSYQRRQIEDYYKASFTTLRDRQRHQ
jgi:hypothetical protein